MKKTKLRLFALAIGSFIILFSKNVSTHTIYYDQMLVGLLVIVYGLWPLLRKDRP